MHHDYRMSEQLFIDVWEEYGKPEELYNKETINSFLQELVRKSEGLIVLDHYSLINFDSIERIEVNGRYTNIVWRDFSDYYEKSKAEKLTEHDEIIWEVFGYTTLEYIMLDITKVKFIIVDAHLFILIQSNYVQQRNVRLIIEKKGEVFNVSDRADRMFSEYWYWYGPAEDENKHKCIVSSLPYYTCVLQPKERVTNGGLSRRIMLIASVKEAYHRLNCVEAKIDENDEHDFDGLFCQGNLIRRILEFALKYFCVVRNIPIEIEQKYAYISLGDLRKAVKEQISIPSHLVNIANTFSHDSGHYAAKEELYGFLEDARKVLEDITNLLLKKREA